MIEEENFGAALNMAIDEALLHCAIESHADVPVIRFYDWEKRAISIGYFQKIQAAVDLAKLSGVDFEIVRRQTGGGIVLHGNDITFSIVFSENFLLNLTGAEKAGVVESYRPVNLAVLDGISRLLGRKVIDLTLEDKPGSMRGTKFCFSVPTRHDVVVGGLKIAGGAQRRIDGYILYQGSILLRTEPEKVLKDFFGGTAVTLEDLRGDSVHRETAVACLMDGFQKIFGEITTAKIDAGLLAAAEELSAEKYSKREWNFFR